MSFVSSVSSKSGECVCLHEPRSSDEVPDTSAHGPFHLDHVNLHRDISSSQSTKSSCMQFADSSDCSSHRNISNNCGTGGLKRTMSVSRGSLSSISLSKIADDMLKNTKEEEQVSINIHPPSTQSQSIISSTMGTMDGDKHIRSYSTTTTGGNASVPWHGGSLLWDRMKYLHPSLSPSFSSSSSSSSIYSIGSTVCQSWSAKRKAGRLISLLLIMVLIYVSTCLLQALISPKHIIIDLKELDPVWVLYTPSVSSLFPSITNNSNVWYQWLLRHLSLIFALLIFLSALIIVLLKCKGHRFILLYRFGTMMCLFMLLRMVSSPLNTVRYSYNQNSNADGFWKRFLDNLLWRDGMEMLGLLSIQSALVNLVLSFALIYSNSAPKQASSKFFSSSVFLKLFLILMVITDVILILSTRTSTMSDILISTVLIHSISIVYHTLGVWSYFACSKLGWMGYDFDLLFFKMFQCLWWIDGLDSGRIGSNR